MQTKSNVLLEQTSELEELKKQHQYFISHLSHEIRNPLTLISSSLQLLEKECPSVVSSSLWPQIKEDIHSTICLLQDVSSLNHIETLHLTCFHAEEFLLALAHSFDSYMKQRKICLSIQLQPNISTLTLYADRRKLQEALTNLLINAADALESCTTQSAPRKIELSANAADTLSSETMLQIHIRDNGSGIPDAYLDTLFEPFVTHKPTGTGLGLPIVKRVAELHHGSIFVDTACTQDNSYTDFLFQIPLIFC